MPMDTGGVDAADIGDSRPSKGVVIEVGPKHDGVLGDFEVAVDQVNTKKLVSLVTDEHSR